MSYREWIELESDPVLFTLLMYDFGVKDVEVEEVYDLSKPIEKDVFGFIFLFKWTEERKSRRKAITLTEETVTYDEAVENEIFFAEQIIPNSCASHALLSVLLNVPKLSIGYTLEELRDSCVGFNAETKGYAIGNFWNLSIAHNNHGRPELRWQQDRSKNITGSTRSMEAFHYVSYIPYNNQLFELDGLKPHPINHGPWFDDETWSDKARRVIQDRIQIATGGELSHDIRYNLMAIVPEQRKVYRDKMEVLWHNKKVLIEVFKKLSHEESFIQDSKSTTLFDTSKENHPLLKTKRKRSSTSDKTTEHKQSTEYKGPQSPISSSSSTLTGQESPTNPLSDSDDSSADTYRIKAMMRGQLTSPVFVYGEETEQQIATRTRSSKYSRVKAAAEIKKENNSHSVKNEIENESNSIENVNDTRCTETINTTNENEVNNIKEVQIDHQNVDSLQGNTNIKKEEFHKADEKPGLGVEIIADDVDITNLLDQSRLEKLSFDEIIKYSDNIKLVDLQHCMQDLDEIFKSCENAYKEELEKIERYKIDDSRRRHNYDPFISTFLTMLADQGHIANLLEQQNTVLKRVSTGYVKNNNNNGTTNNKKDMNKVLKKSNKSKKKKKKV